MATKKVNAKKSVLKPLTKRKAWAALKAHHSKIRTVHLRKLFEDDSKRGDRLTVEALGIYFDFSKNRITEKTLKLLLDLAKESGLRERIDAMFRGDKINVTEQRAVLHEQHTPAGYTGVGDEPAAVLVPGQHELRLMPVKLDHLRIRRNVGEGAVERRVAHAGATRILPDPS